jgi:hypothetical protein
MMRHVTAEFDRRDGQGSAVKVALIDTQIGDLAVHRDLAARAIGYPGPTRNTPPRGRVCSGHRRSNTSPVVSSTECQPPASTDASASATRATGSGTRPPFSPDRVLELRTWWRHPGPSSRTAGAASSGAILAFPPRAAGVCFCAKRPPEERPERATASSSNCPPFLKRPNTSGTARFDGKGKTARQFIRRNCS